MSRIGKKPVVIPAGVTISREGNMIVVKGPKGELRYPSTDIVTVQINEGEVVIVRQGEGLKEKAMHGLVRTLIQNMITGVTEGYVRRLEINGVGYRAQVQGNKLVLSLGYSHPVEYPFPAGIAIKMDEEKKNVIVITGIDKQQVGQVAAEIRSFRKPEPYKGKGVKYEEERIKRKAGKTAAKA